jgi:hypothetical protein
MDRTTLAPDAAALRLRRVGRVARRRMRIDAAELTNGFHTDGTLTVEISGLGSPVAGIPDAFEWEADRPIALVIVRSGIDGEDVDFQVGPSRHGTGRGAGVGDGTGIRYVAFCYDAPVSAGVVVPEPVAAAMPVAAPSAVASPGRRRLAAASAFAPTGRDRRSILGLLLQGPSVRRATT